MTLPSVTVVHVGDVHHPTAATDRVVDAKDEGFPSTVAGIVATSSLQVSVRELLQVIEAHKPAAILFSGDLTDRGQLAGYEECVKYLERVFQIASSPDRFCVVPGNHDVDRNLAGLDDDVFSKFRPLAATWETYSAPILIFDRADIRQIGNGRGTVVFCGLNSCIGCGESRYLTELLPTSDPASPKLAQFERIDTPAFHEAHIQAVDVAIRSAGEYAVPLVLAHHNILPQRTPRIAPYTETLNAGHVRGQLSGKKRPVIYCHGHTHDEPIEVVHQYVPQEGTLISVSAPELRNGFNLLRIYFNSVGRPLGCGIERFQRTQNILEPADEVRIPFCTPRDFRTASTQCKKTFSVLSPKPQKFADVVKSVREEGKRTPSNVIAQALEELEWLSMVRIHEREHEESAWIIERSDND